MVIIFACFIVYNESTAVIEKCIRLQNNVDLGETVPSVCSETSLTVGADGSEVSNIRVEEVFYSQEEEEEEEKDHLAVMSTAVNAADKVCYVCNFVVLTVVQSCFVASAFWQCIVWCLGVSLQ